MKTAILIPVLDEERNLPSLFRALTALRKKSPGAEIHFIDNGSGDASPRLLAEFAAATGNCFVHTESARGFAEPLNRGLAASSSDFVLFLDADALPRPNWARRMEQALASADLAVGETVSRLPGKPSPYGRLAELLFREHSARTARAHGHALPWGPACNLGVRRAWFDRVGRFAPAATSAFDIDWCWRAVLGGARIRFEKNAVVAHLRRNEREALLRQFERYGQGEAWLHRQYSFLLDPEDRKVDPLLAAMDAYARLKNHALASKRKNLPLDEVAAAFAAGVRVGHERALAPCPERRGLPEKAIGWSSGKNEVTVFVPGKGVAQLKGKLVQLWEARAAGAEEEDLVRLFEKLFRATHEEAHHEIESFLEALTP